ncbi:hypothetical protein SMD20_43625 [Nonomuraea sp. LP-02]|uniref:hypothetical protein n=1 Tax=Nonomuraea sp. LP-02 TaxID=3097960 RepID=UPI002E2EC6A4|nr:hypothetical protein [Nonomuraea sp. LP-02]MED7931173.1 hypothetical protein [Nonomuraea sp. LP-02]
MEAIVVRPAQLFGEPLLVAEVVEEVAGVEGQGHHDAGGEQQRLAGRGKNRRAEISYGA